MQEIIISRAKVNLPKSKDQITIRYEFELVKVQSSYAVTRYQFKDNKLSNVFICVFTDNKILATDIYNNAIKDLINLYD